MCTYTYTYASDLQPNAVISRAYKSMCVYLHGYWEILTLRLSTRARRNHKRTYQPVIVVIVITSNQQKSCNQQLFTNRLFQLYTAIHKYIYILIYNHVYASEKLKRAWFTTKICFYPQMQWSEKWRIGTTHNTLDKYLISFDFVYI